MRSWPGSGSSSFGRWQRQSRAAVGWCVRAGRGRPGTDMVRRGSPGTARPGSERPGSAERGSTRNGRAWQSRHGPLRSGKARLNMVRQGAVWQSGRGVVWSGLLWRGRSSRVSRGRTVRERRCWARFGRTRLGWTGVAVRAGHVQARRSPECPGTALSVSAWQSWRGRCGLHGAD